MYVKAGYTKRSGGYGIISFFDGNRPLMILQIIDSEPKHAVERWMNYLSLILPSDEQKSADGDNISGFNLHSLDKLKEIWEMLPKDVELSEKTIETLEKIDKLSVSEIKEFRDYIEKLPEEERADWYLELQKKVPYHNQRDNESSNKKNIRRRCRTK